MPFRQNKRLEFIPHVKVVRFKDTDKSEDGIYYVVSDNNSDELCAAFEEYINSTDDTELKFNIEPLTEREAKIVVLDRRGYNPVTGTVDNIEVVSSWAVFTDVPAYITTMPRWRYKTMENRILNVERISLLLDILPFVIALDRYLEQESNAFKANPVRYRQGLIANHILSLKTYSTIMTYTGNVVRFSNKKMYDMLFDLSNPQNNTSLFNRLLVYTEGN